MTCLKLISSVLLFFLHSCKYCITSQKCLQIAFDWREGKKDRALSASYKIEETKIQDKVECLFKCYDNCFCLSFNFCGTTCELNSANSFSTSGAIMTRNGCTYYDQPLDENYCKRCGMRCKNDGECHLNRWNRTHPECRCPLQYSGKQCERSNAFASKFDKDFGIGSQGLFFVKGKFNYQEASAVCAEFGAQLSTTKEINQSARNDERGLCKRAWTKEGSLGYPEYNGSCHKDDGLHFTGYYSNNCCPEKTNKTNAWCIAKELDYCKSNWYGFRNHCYMYNSDERFTWNEAKEKCLENNGTLAKFPDVLAGSFMEKICPTCNSMHIGINKGKKSWLWLPVYAGYNVASTLWSSGQPHGEGNCAEWKKELRGLKVIQCSAKRGYVCRRDMF